MNGNHDIKDFNQKLSRKTGLLIWFRLARIYIQQIRKTTEHLRQWHLSPAQFDVLAQIGSKEGLTQKELADRLLVTQGNVTQLLDKMISLDLVAKRREGRNKILSLTPKGRELYHDVVPKQEMFQSGSFNVLTEEEKVQLLTLLRKLDHKNRI